jgi:hypothetical protein
MVTGAFLVSIAGDGWMPAAMQSYHAEHTSHEAALRAHREQQQQQTSLSSSSSSSSFHDQSTFGSSGGHALDRSAHAAGGSGGGSDALSLRKDLKDALVARPPALAAALDAYTRRHKEALASKAAADRANYILYVSGVGAVCYVRQCLRVYHRVYMRIHCTLYEYLVWTASQVERS